MSLTLTLTTPAAATYDLALDANHRFGVLGSELPDLEQQVENDLCEFEAGTLELTCRNDDAWWDALLSGADHLARYPDTFSLVVARDGVTRWEGDLDLLTVSYDRVARTVSFTVTGKLARLDKYSAEGVRRACPEGVDWNDAPTSVGAGTFTDTDKAWTTDEFVNHVLLRESEVGTYSSHDAGTDVITLGAAHGWATDTRIVLTGGTFGGLSVGVSYYVNTPSGATLKVATAPGGAAVNLTSAAAVGAPVFLAGVYTITGNTATALSVSGNPTSGAYQIRPTAWATYVDADLGALVRKMTSLGPSIADLGLQEGDKLIITRTGSNPSRIVYLPKRGLYYVGTYEASQQSVAIKHVGPKTYPALTDHEIGVDTDLTVDMELGDHVICGTPYHRDKTVSQLVALLFAEAGLSASDYTIDVPTLTNNVIPYADFDGKNVGGALKELAKIAGCVLAATPTKYLFVRREVIATDGGRGGSLDLIAQKWAEQQFADQSADVVKVEGSDEQTVTRGLVDFLARPLTINTSMVSDYAWLKQIADRNTAAFLGTRRAADVSILDGWGQNAVVDPSFEGTLAVGGDGSRWQIDTAAGAGETLAKSATYAGHMRKSLRLRTLGTALQSKQLLFASGTVTASSSSGLLLTYTNDFGTWARVRFTTTDTLPTGLSVDTDYWTVRVNATTCRVATSLVNAIAGTVIAYADAGTGTHTMTLQGITDLAAGETVHLAARAYLPTFASGRLRVDLYGKSSAGAVVLTSSSLYWSAANADFTDKSESVAIPATVTHLWLRIHAASSPSFDGYVDEIRVERTAKVAPCLLQRMALGDHDYLAWGIRESLQSSVLPGIMELDLLGETVTALSSAYDTTSDEATPPQPTVDSISMDLYVPAPAETDYTATLAWPYSTAPIAKVLVTIWTSTADRPDTPTNVQVPYAYDATTLEVTFIVMATVTANSRYVDFTVLYADGRVSQPTAPELLPASV